MGRSRTAVLVAGYRARESAKDESICSDPWAAAMAGAEAEKLVERFDELHPHLGLWIALRTAYLDARCKYLLGPTCRFKQVVVLGAGLDARAARLAAPGVQFFEVDRPASHAYKQERISALPDYPADAATYVTCDFESDDFLDRLKASGFGSDRPAVVLWEGVTPYLSEDAVRATLSRIASGCHPRTTVFFDHVGERLARGAVKNEADLQTRDVLDDLGEPIRWGSDHVLPLLHDVGFRRAQVRNFDELALNLTGTYDRDRKWRFSHIAEASVRPPEAA